MSRWVHALFAVVALMVVVLLVVLWPQPRTVDPVPDPAPAPSSALPPPTGPPTGPPSVPPTGSPIPPPPSPTCTEATPARLRVVTFNIHGAVRRNGSYDIRGIADEIRSWDADVVLLQEVHLYRARSGMDDQPAELGRLLGMNAVFGRNFTKPPDAPGAPRRQSGTAILSKRPISSWQNQLLPNFPGLQQRGLLRATIEVGGQDVDVYNTHLQHTRGVIRIVQTRAIRRLVAGASRPFLLGGDFNAEPGSPAMRIVADVARDPWPQVGTGPGLTVPPRVPQRRIDFVLHSPDGWVPEQAQVIQSAIADHRAVLVDYALPRRTC